MQQPIPHFGVRCGATPKVGRIPSMKRPGCSRDVHDILDLAFVVACPQKASHSKCRVRYQSTALAGAQTGSDELKDVFESHLAAAGKMLVLLDSFVDPIYIRRAWCIFESFVCIDRKFPMTFILPQRAEGTFIEILDESGSFSKLKNAFESMDVRCAEASSNSDVVSSKAL